jgi:RNA polymerase-associated protein
MAVVANKRSVMTLYSGPLCPYSHRVRIVLAEKGVTYDLLEINDETQSDALVEINPYGSVPTLVDRDLVLYQADIIMEYLDERFPHPPLMPVYPVARATSRLYLHRVNHEWYSKINILLDKKSDAAQRATARKELADSLISIGPIFNNKSYFFSEEFSLVDAAIGPLLWRLPSLGIELPANATAVREYGKRLFNRDAFQVSLTETEKALGGL